MRCRNPVTKNYQFYYTTGLHYMSGTYYMLQVAILTAIIIISPLQAIKAIMSYHYKPLYRGAGVRLIYHPP